MLFQLITVIIVSFAVAQDTTSVDLNCVIGSTWVIDYIKFECYSNGTIVRGVKPIGISIYLIDI